METRQFLRAIPCYDIFPTGTILATSCNLPENLKSVKLQQTVIHTNQSVVWIVRVSVDIQGLHEQHELLFLLLSERDYKAKTDAWTHDDHPPRDKHIWNINAWMQGWTIRSITDTWTMPGMLVDYQLQGTNTKLIGLSHISNMGVWVRVPRYWNWYADVFLIMLLCKLHHSYFSNPVLYSTAVSMTTWTLSMISSRDVSKFAILSISWE